MNNLDGLAEKILLELSIKNESPQSWIKDKRNELLGKDRLHILRWICNSLDAGNKKIAADILGITPEHLDITGEVLRKI